MADEPNRPNAAELALDILGQLNPLILAVASIMASIRAIRDAARAANPSAPDGTIPSDGELISRLFRETGFYDVESPELRRWLESLNR